MVPAVAGELPEVVKVSACDLGAFAELFETERPAALRLAYAMTGDASVAEDVVAEAFARTYERWVKGKIDNPSAYVRRSVVNEARSAWRRLAVRRKHATRERHVEPSTAFRADQIADADVLQRALSTLGPRQRAVVVLRVVDDLSEQDVADALGCSVGTVKSSLSRGLDRLRDALTGNQGVSDV
jgi:RNA polymerase sigma-70 factor (sigma-E family)